MNLHLCSNICPESKDSWDSFILKVCLLVVYFLSSVAFPLSPVPRYLISNWSVLLLYLILRFLLFR